MYWYNNIVALRSIRMINIWSRIEVAITSTIGNRVAVMSGTWVQIPPTPP